MAETKTKNYIEAVGKRKTSIARVRISKNPKAGFVINDRELKNYFPTAELQELIKEAITKSTAPDHFMVSARITGGGIHSQAEALRHGIARALILYNTTLRDPLKKAGLITRDARIKERRKFGLKKARKAPQWSKR